MMRMHAQIRATLGTTQLSPTSNISQIELGVGIESALSTTSPIPTPLTTPFDYGAPSQRWLHWRVLHFTGGVLAVPNNPTNCIYLADSPADDLDIRAQVKAPTGDQLNLLLAWEPAAALASDWHVRLEYWASILVS